MNDPPDRRSALVERTVGHLVMASGPGFRNGGQFRIGVHMAGTGAIPQLAAVVFDTAGGLVMAFGLERARMAAATSGPVGCKLPGRRVCVGRVTGRARRGATMVARVLRRGVYENRRGPVRIAMTGRAVPRGRHVIGDLPDGCRAVVAALAVADDSRVIEAGRAPGQRSMTGAALLRGRHVIAGERRGLHARVASTAGIGGTRDEICVLHANGSEGVGCMAGAAIVVARHVAGVLARRRQAVVAAENSCRGPPNGPCERAAQSCRSNGTARSCPVSRCGLGAAPSS